MQKLFPAAMNHVERFRAVINFQPIDRLPLWEWAMWWDETIKGRIFDTMQNCN